MQVYENRMPGVALVKLNDREYVRCTELENIKASENEGIYSITAKHTCNS